MRIVCPICSAAYEVRETLLSPGRPVRCTRCGEEWVPIPATAPDDETELDQANPLTEPESSFAAPPRLTAMERLATHPAQVQYQTAGLRAAWAASLIVLLLFGWGLVVWRGDVMRAWPPSTRLYTLLGFAAAPPPAR